MKKLPVYEMLISDDPESDLEVDFIALVDRPAIKKDFVKFSEDFVEPAKGERETDFIPRCISYVVSEGKDVGQAAAICNSIWEQHFAEADSWNDYPEAAVNNAKRALKWADENGWGDCGEATGKIRANQIANRENLTRDTIARISGFRRHQQNKDVPYSEGCGGLMWDAWGGDAMIDWAERKLRQIERQSFAIQDEEERVISGPLMLADTPIYRNDQNGEYYVQFSKDTIKQIAQKFFRKGYQQNKDVPYSEGCGGLMWDAWGGDAMIDWAERKLRQIEKQNFAIQDEEEKVISGPLMLADTPIYRNDQNGEYYVQFSKDTIKQIAQKFFRKGYQQNVNLMHDSGNIVNGLTMFESWITDSKRGIKAMVGFEDVPDGSWFGSFKVENDEVWGLIKENKVKGFSVEGVFNYRKTGDKKYEAMWQEIVKILEQVS